MDQCPCPSEVPVFSRRSDSSLNGALINTQVSPAMSETKCVQFELEQGVLRLQSPAPLEAGNSAKGSCALSLHCLESELCAVC